MGLDRVELLYRLEEEFEISISDEEAEKMNTPRKIIDYLMVRPEVEERWSRDYVTLSVWMILEEETGIDRHKYTEDSRLIEDMGLD